MAVATTASLQSAKTSQKQILNYIWKCILILSGSEKKEVCYYSPNVKNSIQELYYQSTSYSKVTSAIAIL